MRYFGILMIVITSVFCKAQSTGEIESVNASIIAKTKRIYSTVNGRTLIFYKDTAYTVAMVVKTNNLQVGEKLVIKVGLTQNDTIALNQKFKIKDKPNNGRAIGQDVTPYVEIDEVTNGYVKLFFDFPASDFEKLKWVTAFIKNDTNSSTKKYYEFQ